MPLKIALVGAGSYQFGPATIRDILLSDPVCAQDLEVVLMDVGEDALGKVMEYAIAVRDGMRRRCTIVGTTDLDVAVRGADFVVAAIELRRYYYWAQDFHVPRTYGCQQIYGENGGPGGLFHALRNMGPMLEIARSMETHSPEAWLLNYTNPLTKLCEALTRNSSIKTIGLCHGVFQGMKQVSGLLGQPLEELELAASGLNHFTWFQEIRSRATGEDLYPKLRERERTANWLAEWDEIALSRILLRTFGLYPSPGTNHIGEYIGWASEFLASSTLQFFGDHVSGMPWDSEPELSWVYNLHKNVLDRPLFADRGRKKEVLDPALPIKASGELAIPLIEGLYCGEERKLAAVNVPNEGVIPDLPSGAVVEVPAVARFNELKPRRMPRLPEGILALLRRQVSINQLLIKAFNEQSRSILLQAVLMEPSVCSYRNAVQMLNEMCRLQTDVLPPLRW